MELSVVAGWIGAFGILILYILNLYKKNSIDSPVYLLANLGSASLLIMNAIYLKAFPFILINSFWVIVSFISLVRNHKGKKEK